MGKFRGIFGPGLHKRETLQPQHDMALHVHVVVLCIHRATGLCKGIGSIHEASTQS